MRLFTTYKVKIREQPFVTQTGDRYASTAGFTFYDANNNEIEYLEKGYRENKVLYEKIDRNEKICLDECYTNNFSLSEYRKSRGLKQEAPVYLINFSAREAVFDASDATDLSYSHFAQAPVGCEGALFLGARVIFRGSIFQKGINLSYTLFKNGELDFSDTTLSRGELNLKNSFFGRGNKNFQNFLCSGHILFQNTEFNADDVSFTDSRFEGGKISFRIARFDAGKIDFHFSKFRNCNLSFERSNKEQITNHTLIQLPGKSASSVLVFIIKQVGTQFPCSFKGLLFPPFFNLREIPR